MKNQANQPPPGAGGGKGSTRYQAIDEQAGQGTERSLTPVIGNELNKNRPHGRRSKGKRRNTHSRRPNWASTTRPRGQRNPGSS